MANKLAKYTTGFDSDIHPHKPFIHDRLTITDLLLTLRKLRLRPDSAEICAVNFALVLIGAETAESKERLERDQVRSELMEIASLLIERYQAKLVIFVSPIFGPNPDENTFENIKTINLAMRDCVYRHVLRQKLRYVHILHHFLPACRRPEDIRNLRFDQLNFRPGIFQRAAQYNLNTWTHTVLDNIVYSLRSYIAKLANDKVFDEIYGENLIAYIEQSASVEYVLNDELLPEEMRLLMSIGNTEFESKFDSGCGLTSMKGAHFDTVVE